MAESLFDKYGGMPTIFTIIEDFYSKVLSHPRLTPYFDGVNVERLMNHQAAFVAMLMGAPASLYTYKSMKEAHAHLKITEESFNLVAVALEGSLRDGGVEEPDIATMMEAVGKYKDDIVTA